MLATFLRMMLAGLLFLALFSPISTAKRPARAANCRPYEVPVEVDSSNHGYKPYYVDMHRCKGQCSQASPHHCECVPATQKDVTINVVNPAGFKQKVLQNHTSCTNKCKESFKDICNNGGHLWNEATCTCACPKSPIGKACNAKQQWDSGKCQCVCKNKSRACSQGMIWDKLSCGCECSRTTFTQCSKIGRVTNIVTCRCETQAAVTGQYTSNKLNGSETNLVVALVVIGLLLGILFIIDLVLMCSKRGFMYGIVTKCSENKDARKFTREETDTGSVMLENDNNFQQMKTNGKCNHLEPATSV